MDKITVDAPASVANVGPGFDVFGFALDSPTDIIHATKLEDEPKNVIITKTNLEDIPLDPQLNTAGVAASYILNKIDANFGISMDVEKGLGIGTGLGSSAASAAAAAKAVQYFADEIPESVILEGLVEAERMADGGIHGDNAVPAFLGGFIVIPSSKNPLIYSKFNLPSHLRIILATPPIKVLTKHAREVIPKQVPLNDSINTTGYAGLVIAGIVKKDLRLMGKGIVDPIIEPVRAQFIPNFHKVKQSALNAGAFGCSISGAGPTVFAIADEDSDLRNIGRAMAEAFDLDETITIRIGLPNNDGAKILARSYQF